MTRKLRFEYVFHQYSCCINNHEVHFITELDRYGSEGWEVVTFEKFGPYESDAEDGGSMMGFRALMKRSV